jgi:hypothetical protein
MASKKGEVKDVQSEQAVFPVSGPPYDSRPDWAWIEEHFGDSRYAGKFVVLSHGEVVAVGDGMGDPTLAQQLKSAEVPGRQTTGWQYPRAARSEAAPRSRSKAPARA